MNKQKKVAIVIPFYRETVFEFEAMALEQCQTVLSDYPKIAIKPGHLTLPAGAYKCTYADVISFDDKYFKGIKGYNSLMLSPAFYRNFFDYEYILIYQLDAFVFKDELNYWCKQGYDYIGAPWVREKAYRHIFKELASRTLFYIHTRFNITKNGLPTKKQFDNKVGNGGFSLRRVKKFHDICGRMQPEIVKYLNQDEHEYNEDAFWSVEVNRNRKRLNIPSYKVGVQFSIEIFPKQAFKINKYQLPFGCHAWDIHLDFWRPIFERFGYKI